MRALIHVERSKTPRMWRVTIWPLQWVLLIGILLFLTACATPAPVNRPCGIIADSLKTVQATTPAGQQRLDIHFERGRAAGCWK